MQNQQITEKDRQDAMSCVKCPLCKRARKKQRGLAYMFVKWLEGGLCPKCKAYEKVYGRKAHEPLPEQEQQKTEE
jgi:hypothetical protein